MIYVTGDLHGDLKAFKKRKLHKLKQGDKLIVTGDFGFVFDDSQEENKKRQWLKKQKCEILFVDGAHDNHSLIDTFETVELYGSIAKCIEDNIYCLVRGEVYTIEDKTIFAFGSGLSENYLMKEDPDSLFILPTMEEISVELADKVKVCKMNVDEAPETPATLGIRSIPSLMMFKDGKLIDSKVGLNSKSSVVEWILANA